MKGKITIFAFLGFIIFFVLDTRGTDGKSVGTDADDSVWYYDPQSISHGQESVVVGTKQVLSNKAKEEVVMELNDSKGIEKISYTLIKVELDCLRHEFRVINMFWFSSDCTCLASSPKSSEYRIA